MFENCFKQFKGGDFENDHHFSKISVFRDFLQFCTVLEHIKNLFFAIHTV